jgi:hypothetical protein
MASVEDLSPEDFAKAAAWDPEEAHRKGDELELQAHEGYAEVEKIIRLAKDRHKTITFEAGGEKVAIRTMAAVPYDLRVRISRFFKTQQDQNALPTDPAAAVGEMYALIAALCLDAPWTDPKTWAYVDRMTGQTPKLFDAAILEINDFSEMVERFRGRG